MVEWVKRGLRLVWVIGLVTLPGTLEAQDRTFHGLYVGAEIGREDLIGGSFVDGIDFLAQDSRRVVSLVAGARYQTSVGLVFGAEGTWGSTDGDLALDDAARDLQIAYENDSQTSLGATIGFAPDASWLLFAWASEVTRHFDVRVTQGDTAFTQKDEQGMLRYGVGLEVSALRNLHLRAKVGRGRADFGDARTNFEPEQPLQFAFGVAVQF